MDIYNWIKITDIIDLVRSELKTMNEQGKILTDDCITWAVEALRDIGTPSVFDEQWSMICIRDHTGIMPNDVYQIDVAYKLTQSAYQTYVLPVVTDNLKFLQLGESEIKKMVNVSIPLKYGGTELKMLLTNSKNLYVSTSDSFILQGRRVITSYKDGYFLLSYFGLYLDENGIPMIPDDIDIVNAIKAYIRFKLFEEPFYMKEEGSQGPYIAAKTDWENKLAHAQNSSLLPTISEAIERVNDTANRYWKFSLPNNYGFWR